MQRSRRTLLKSGIAFAAMASRNTAAVLGQTAPPVNTGARQRTVDTPVLRIGFEESGNPQGFPIVLLHGFPDDVRAWDGVVPPLAAAGYRVLVPYVRGHGATRLKDARAPKMAEQAAIGQDLIDFADALQLQRFAVAGFDWGNRAACIAAALHSDRVRGAVLIGGYTIQDTIGAPQPLAPEREQRLWYQWYFNTERGRLGLAANRRPLCRLLWQLWSPTWHFTDETFNRTAPSFDNPDFVDCVIHSYRHRNLGAAGEPRFADLERKLAMRPKIEVPSIVLYGADDGVGGTPAVDSPAERDVFTHRIGRQVVAGAGHFVPREKPEAVVSALTEVMRATR
jgi:pimeloyl-ACP methyl ester carboxylesterase